MTAAYLNEESTNSLNVVKKVTCGMGQNWAKLLESVGADRPHPKNLCYAQAKAPSAANPATPGQPLRAKDAGSPTRTTRNEHAAGVRQSR